MKSNSQIENTSSNYIWTLILLVLIIACKKQGDQTPDSTDKANVSVAEHENFLITDLGDTVITGIPIPIIGQRIDAEQLRQPRSRSFGGPSKVIPANNNVRAARSPRVGKVLSEPEIITPGLDGLPLPESTLARGEKIVAGQPQPIEALTPEMKENATGNIQYWDIDHGMNNGRAVKLIEDKLGNLWILSPPSGISRFDGQNFTHYTTSEGLHFNASQNMYLDSKGTLWIGGWQGLSSFDGTHFTQYLTASGLTGSTVLSMLEDDSGRLWFATQGGATRFDGERFTRFFFHEEKWLNFKSMIQDSKGYLWFGCNDGIYYFDPSQDDDALKVINYTEDQGLSDNRINAMLEDNAGNIWIGTNDGLNKWDGKQFFNYSTDQGLADNTINSIMEDSQSELWIGTNEGANHFDGNHFLKITTEEGLSDNGVKDILEDNGGNIWLGTNDGLNRYRSNSFQFIPEEKFLDRNITGIQESKNGDLWFGLTQGGLTHYKESNFLNYGANEIGDLRNTNAILEDSKGRLWIGGSKGLKVIDDNTLKSYSYSSGSPNFFIRCLFEDANGTIWIGANDGVSSFASPKQSSSGSGAIDQKFEVTRYTEDHGMTGWVVNAIMEDTEGHIWFAMDDGVTKYEINDDHQSGTFTHFTKNEGFSSERVIAMLAGEQGEVWFATSGDGIFQFHPGVKDGKRFTQYTTSEGLSHNIVNSLVLDNQENIWAGTIRGLSVLKPILNNNNLASSGPADDYQIIDFQKSDGLKYLSFRSSATIDSKNRIWWGTGDGVTMLDLNLFKTETNPPRVRLNHININEEYVDIGRLKDSSYRRTIPFGQDLQNALSNTTPFYNYPQELKLPYHLNHLTFFFSGIDWAAPHKIKYSYMIAGLEDDWSLPNHQAKADYRNIPSGNYTLKIRAIGTAQKWSDTFEYAFRVLPPWWLSNVSYGIYGLLFLGGIYLLQRSQKSRIEKIERQKAQVKELEQAKEIEKAYHELGVSHENLKSTQAQLIQSEKMASLGELTAGIAHEIQNPLNFVNNFSDISSEMIDELQEEITKGDLKEIKAISGDIKQNLNKISHHGNRASSIVKGMLDHSRANTGEKMLTDINALCDEYLRLSYHGLRAKDSSFNASFESHFDESLPKIKVIPQDIGRVLLNVINNAFFAVDAKAKANAQPLTPKENPARQMSTGQSADSPLGARGARGENSNTPPPSPKGATARVSDEQYKPVVILTTFTGRSLGEGGQHLLTTEANAKEVNNLPAGEAGSTIITISDNGIGMSKSTIEKVFQPFFTTKPTGHGTGLGMSISYDIITKGHRGEIKVESTEGKGTKFIINLPVD